MLHALTAPVGKTLVLGGLAVVALAVARPHHDRFDRRLVLHAEARPDATYLTVFRDNQLWMNKGGAPLSSLIFTTRGNVSADCKLTDEAPACHWVGTEELVPINAHEYSYTYTEDLLDCDPGAVQACIATPRTGIVTVED